MKQPYTTAGSDIVSLFMRGSILAILVIVTLVPMPVTAGGDGPARTFGAEYIPYNRNITLVYDTPFGETVAKVSERNGVTVITNESEDFRYNQRLIVNDDGVHVKEVYQKFKIIAFVTKENSFTYDRPLLRIPFPLTEGESWSWKGVEYCDGDEDDITVTGKVIGSEKVTVPAGTFDAVKIETRLTSAGGSKNIIYEWLSPNVGIVKTKVIVQGGGFIGLVRDLLGYGEIEFNLKKIIRRGS